MLNLAHDFRALPVSSIRGFLMSGAGALIRTATLACGRLVIGPAVPFRSYLVLFHRCFDVFLSQLVFVMRVGVYSNCAVFLFDFVFKVLHCVAESHQQHDYQSRLDRVDDLKSQGYIGSLHLQIMGRLKLY